MAALLAIVRLTLAEARASRLPWVALCLLVAAAGAGEFTARLALAEATELRLATAAALARLALVGLLAMFAVTSVQRERQDGHWRFLFARPMPRRRYIVAKAMALAVLAMAGSALAGMLVLALSAPALRSLAWAALLWAEMIVTALFALACAISLAHPVSALSATAAFYVLARSRVAPFDLVVPRLDLFARSEWLLYTDPLPVGWLALQAAVAVIVLAALAAADLRRRAL